MFQIETIKRAVFLTLLLLLSACKPGESTSSNNNNTNTENQGDPPMCVLPACAAPPEGCSWQDPEIVDGCQINCGTLVCGGSCDYVMSPCAAPPEGCRYENPEIVDGCPVTCGTLVCDEFCPMMLCPAIAYPCTNMPEWDPGGCPICGPPICLTE